MLQVGDTLLHAAAREGKGAVVEFLLSHPSLNKDFPPACERTLVPFRICNTPPSWLEDPLNPPH